LVQCTKLHLVRIDSSLAQHQLCINVQSPLQDHWNSTWIISSYSQGYVISIALCVLTLYWAVQAVGSTAGRREPHVHTTQINRHPHHAAHLDCHNLPTSKHGVNPPYHTLFYSMLFSCLNYGLKGGVVKGTFEIQKSSQIDKPITESLSNFKKLLWNHNLLHLCHLITHTPNNSSSQSPKKDLALRISVLNLHTVLLFSFISCIPFNYSLLFCVLMYVKSKWIILNLIQKGQNLRCLQTQTLFTIWQTSPVICIFDIHGDVLSIMSHV
jgi:hypothetical protein